jgi:hypothetical protein
VHSRKPGVYGITEVAHLRGAMKKQCRHKKPDSRRCQANAIARSEFCFFHDPEQESERFKAQRAGGLRNKGAALPPDTPDCDLKSVGDVVTLLGTTINQIRRGQIDPRVANSVGYLSGILLKAMEGDALERRVSGLEMATKNQLQSSSPFDTEEFQFIQGASNAQPETADAN